MYVCTYVCMHILVTCIGKLKGSVYNAELMITADKSTLNYVYQWTANVDYIVKQMSDHFQSLSFCL